MRCKNCGKEIKIGERVWEHADGWITCRMGPNVVAEPIYFIDYYKLLMPSA